MTRILQERHRLRLLGGAAALLLLAMTAAVSAPTVARADTATTISLKLGQSVVEHYAITGVAADELAAIDAYSDAGAGSGYPTPADCAASPSHGCLVVPIDLKIPASYLTTRDMALNIELSWKDVVVPAPTGAEETQTERGYLWQDKPPKDASGNPIWNQYDFGTNPGFVSQVQFTTTHFFLEIIQTRSQNQPITASFSFQDLTDQSFGGAKSYTNGAPKAPKPPTGPQPPAAPAPAQNPATGTAVGVGGSAPAGAVPPTGQAPQVAQIVVPDIRGGAVDPQLLAAADVSLPNRIGVGGAKAINGVVATRQLKVTPASPLAALLGLGALPVLGAALAFILVLRRRRRQNATG